ncbi:hypothetical protein DFH06DRAFT_1120562 [Mycena polygramma]|nr:hypothetical protein DFH06DRAFT_1120562 [Mycena polygramma]
MRVIASLGAEPRGGCKVRVRCKFEILNIRSQAVPLFRLNSVWVGFAAQPPFLIAAGTRKRGSLAFAFTSATAETAFYHWQPRMVHHLGPGPSDSGFTNPKLRVTHILGGKDPRLSALERSCQTRRHLLLDVLEPEGRPSTGRTWRLEHTTYPISGATEWSKSVGSTHTQPPETSDLAYFFNHVRFFKRGFGDEAVGSHTQVLVFLRFIIRSLSAVVRKFACCKYEFGRHWDV